VLNGPVMCGLCYIVLRKIRSGEGPEFNDIGKGFEVFIQALLACIVSGALISLGMLFCVIPGVVLGVGYTFVYFLVVDRQVDF